MASLVCHILSLHLKHHTYVLKTQVILQKGKFCRIYRFYGLIGFPGLGLGFGSKMGHRQLQTEVASQSLLLPVEPHEPATETVCPFPPITRIIESLSKTDIPLDTFDFRKS